MRVGLDLLEIDRLEQALERRPGLAERLFTDGERAYAAGQGAPRPASRGAVLRQGGGREGAAPRGVELAGHRGGQRQDEGTGITLHGALAERAADVQITLTHSRGMAGAVAVSPTAAP